MKSITSFSTIRSAATEIISIVVGVLLALAVNEWNENRVHKTRANEAIQNVILEINSNVKFMSVVNANNRAIIDLLNSKSTNSGDESSKQFVPGLQIQDTAWQMLHSSGVSEFIDYSTLYEISAIYSLQDIYKNLGYQLVKTITNNRALVLSIAPDKSEGIDNQLFLSDMMLIEKVEKALLENYTKTLEKLKNR
jgi:hypothetical protein